MGTARFANRPRVGCRTRGGHVLLPLHLGVAGVRGRARVLSRTRDPVRLRDPEEPGGPGVLRRGRGRLRPVGAHGPGLGELRPVGRARSASCPVPAPCPGSSGTPRVVRRPCWARGRVRRASSTGSTTRGGRTGRGGRRARPVTGAPGRLSDGCVRRTRRPVQVGRQPVRRRSYSRPDGGRSPIGRGRALKPPRVRVRLPPSPRCDVSRHRKHVSPRPEANLIATGCGHSRLAVEVPGRIQFELPLTCRFVAVAFSMSPRTHRRSN